MSYSKVNFFSTSTKTFPWQKKFERIALSLLKSEKKQADINVILCLDLEQRQLNYKYRKLDRTTDVLSFVWDEPELLGEIYIAKEQVKKQAPLYNNSYYNELKRVLIHGLLHLCGYDHNNTKERKIMREKEKFYLY